MPQPFDLDGLLSDAAATLDTLGRPAAARMLRELVRTPQAMPPAAAAGSHHDPAPALAPDTTKSLAS